jgi:hypothetical protein
MKSLIIAMLLVLAAPAFAFTPTAAQKKDMDRLFHASWRCFEYNPGNGSDPAYAIPEAENQVSKKACDLSEKLQDKLTKQGFCIMSLHRPPGRTNKKTGQCDEVRAH